MKSQDNIAQSSFLMGDTVQGRKVQKDWLKGEPSQNYRALIKAALERSELRYQQKTTSDKDKQESITKKLQQSEKPSQEFIQMQRDQYKTCDPVLPNLIDERQKLGKLSRTCAKGYLERFFQIDKTQESLVYYEKEQDSKPKKVLSLQECRITIEWQSKQDPDDQVKNNLALWKEKDKPFRIAIKLKQRKFIPVYHYTDSLHESSSMKATIEHLMNSDSKILSQVINYSKDIFKLQAFNKFYNIVLVLRKRKINMVGMMRAFNLISEKYYKDRKETLQFLDSETRRCRKLEREEKIRLEELKRLQAMQEEVDDLEPPTIELQEPDPIPDLYSTVKVGMVKISQWMYLRTYSKAERSMKDLAQIIRDRRKKRHPVIQDMITKKLEMKFFPTISGSYRVNDLILEHLVKQFSLYDQNKIGDIPYLINDINSIQGIRFEGENLIIIDRKRHEYILSIGEICFISTDISYGQGKDNQFKLQLRGRKINKNVEMYGENILTQQIQVERQKYSRLIDKQIITFSLKKIQIPTHIMTELRKRYLAPKNKLMFRLKFEIGEFYYYSTLFAYSGNPLIEMKEEINLDIEEVKHLKISLIAIRGRQSPYNQLINEFVNEEIVSFVIIKVRDFVEQGQKLMHQITFNGFFYDTKDVDDGKRDAFITLTTAFAIESVNGAFQCAELEGNQLLVGKLVIYKKDKIARVLKVNKNSTCSIELTEEGQNENQQIKILIENVSIRADITLIERYGLSVYNCANPPQNFTHGQFEWNLDITFNGVNQSELALLQKLNEVIRQIQAKQIYSQRSIGMNKNSKNQSFVAGKLYLSVINGQNIQSVDRSACECYVQVSIQEQRNQSNTKFIDIANEQSFIQCKKNSDILQSKTFKTSIVKGSLNPQWVSQQNPQGETFDLGMFMKKFPHSLLIEVYNQKKKSRFSTETIQEHLGFAELNTEDLISLENYGQEFYVFLEDSPNRSALLKVRTLFVPSHGTIERLNLDISKSIFKNSQQFLFFKTLQMVNTFDEYGYLVPIGHFLNNSAVAESQSISDLTTLKYDTGQFLKRYEKFSPEHKKHLRLKATNSLRPKAEENVYVFKQLWLYSQSKNRNNALNERQRVFWEEFMTELMNSAGDEGLIDDELKSIRSKLTNTTKMMSSKYRKRSRHIKTTKDQPNTGGEGSARGEIIDKSNRFSVIFVGQWEKDQSWKYVDIWFLIKFGIPVDLRLSLWKDLLRRQIHEQYEYIFYKKGQPYGALFNANLTNYENMKIFANQRDSIFYQQIEQDVKEFVFPDCYMKNQMSIREDKMEEERLSIYQILKVYALWAHEFSKRRFKILTYNRGMVYILQRLLTIMSEEDSFWTLLGMIKAFNYVLISDFYEPKDPNQVQHDQYSPYTNRRAAGKNQMTILNCLIKIHFPMVFDHLKSLGFPIEWYFYDSISSFFVYDFSSSVLLRLWDMIVFNLSTNQVQNRKRALWYLLAVPLYMIKMNAYAIMKCQDPYKLKQLLLQNTGAQNYNPNLFIDELLQIIKEVFVIKDTMVNKILKNDKAYQLENYRAEIEGEVYSILKDRILIQKQISKYINEKHQSIVINTKALLNNNRDSQPQKYEIAITLLALRNVLAITQKEESLHLQLITDCEEKVNSPIFESSTPITQDQALFLQQDIQITVKSRLSIASGQLPKKMLIKLVLIQNDIHQDLLGTAQIDLTKVLSSLNEERFCLKLFSVNSANQNQFIDLKIQAINRTKMQDIPTMIAISPNIGQIKLNSSDIGCIDFYQKHRDQEISQKINYKQLLQNIDKIITQNQNPQELTQILRSLQIDDILIKEFINQTQQIKQLIGRGDVRQDLRQIQGLIAETQDMVQSLKLNEQVIQDFTWFIISVILQGTKVTSNETFELIYQVFNNNNNQMNLSDMARIVQQMYKLALYPMPINEIYTLLRSLSGQDQVFCGISRAFQQTIPEQQFALFGKATMSLPINYDVSDQVRLQIQSYIRVTGFISNINMKEAPFNNIGYWVKLSQIQKGKPHLLIITLSDQFGNQHDYNIKFDTNGMFDQSNQISSLPLNICGTQSITKQQFSSIMNSSLPLISDQLRQELFINEQLYGSQEMYVDSSNNHKVNFQSVNRRFVFLFLSDKDKQEDFTVDPSQMMRLAKGDISQIYRKKKDENGEIIEIRLSGLSRQDTFIMIKQRMRIVLDWISQSENFSDVPNILSERFQFRRIINADNQNPAMNDKGYYFNSMSRIGNVTSVKDVQFELNRVQPQSDSDQMDQYNSLALFTHSSGMKEWRPCRIIMKIQDGKYAEEKYRIEFKHEKENKFSYIYPREDVLLSFDYKRSQVNYFQDEIEEFLDKLDKEELQIAEIMKDQEKQGMSGAGGLEDIKRNIQFGGEEGLKIGNKDLDEEKDEEQKEIEKFETEQLLHM